MFRFFVPCLLFNLFIFPRWSFWRITIPMGHGSPRTATRFASLRLRPQCCAGWLISSIRNRLVVSTVVFHTWDSLGWLVEMANMWLIFLECVETAKQSREVFWNRQEFSNYKQIDFSNQVQSITSNQDNPTTIRSKTNTSLAYVLALGNMHSENVPAFGG